MTAPVTAPVPRREALHAFARIGLLSFGGPAAQIALMHKVLVDEKGWLSERQFLGALSFCMVLPGPEAMQMATYAGWRVHGVRGGLAAGLLFVLPGAAVVLALAMIYGAYGQAPLTEALFLGVKAAVLAIVIEALLRVAKRALKGPAQWVIAGAAFAGLFLFSLPFPLVIACAALYGALFGKAGGPDTAAPVTASARSTARTALIWLAIWLGPLAVLHLSPAAPVLAEVGAFFAKLAVVTFGGAYAVLAYMAQDVVTGFGWLSAGEMMDGLGLAETTPGPLILVTEFVGYLAALREGGVWLGVAGALVTLWATFAPCFLWIFVGAPYIEWISAQPRLNGALSAITAAVVGVIGNLSIWFGLHVLFADVTLRTLGPLTLWTPDPATINWIAAGLAALAALLLLRLHWGVARVLALCSALGWALTQAVQAAGAAVS